LARRASSARTLSGNVVPATAGETLTRYFRLDPLKFDDGPDVLQAVERQGPLSEDVDLDPGAERAVVVLLSLPETDTRGLGFLDLEGNLRTTEPEVEVQRHDLTEPTGAAIAAGPYGSPLTFHRQLLFAGSDDPAFTLEDGLWQRVVGYQRPQGEVVHQDYRTGRGYTVRLGDGMFGEAPDRPSFYRVRYRTGPGKRDV